MDGDFGVVQVPNCMRTGAWAADFQELKVGVGGSIGRVGLGSKQIQATG